MCNCNRFSLGHVLKRIPKGHFYQAWYSFVYEIYPRVDSMFDVSKSTFYMMKFPTNKDLSWLENEIYTNRFNWSLAHYGEDVGEEECCKAVMFAICGFTLFEAAAERLRLEIKNRPNITAKSAIQIVRLFLQSMKTNEKLLPDAKFYSSQSNLSGVNYMLPSYIDNEANISKSSQRCETCSNIKSHTSLCNSNYKFPLNVYQYYMKHLSLSASDVPTWLYCRVESHKTRQCITNRKDSRYDPTCVIILQDSIGRVVDSNEECKY